MGIDDSKSGNNRPKFDMNGQIYPISIFKLIFAGLVITGYLLRRLPLFEKIVFLIVTIFLYFMPVGIEIIEGEIGYWNIVGVNLGGKFTYDVVAQMFGLFYVGYIAAGFQFLFCLAIMKNWINSFFWMECF